MSELLLALHRRRQKHGEFNERQFQRARQRYRNVVRRRLMGTRAWPPARDGAHKARRPICWIDWISDARLAFTLITGRNIPINYCEMCIVRGSINPIVVTKNLEQHLMNTAGEMLREIMSGKKMSSRRPLY